VVLSQFLLFTLILALLLFLPVSRLAWALDRRRRRRIVGRELTEAESDASLGRARTITALLVLGLSVVLYLGFVAGSGGGGS
jgi:hypothetical protein